MFKLYVGRMAESKDYFELFVELPIDIVFLSFSFSIVYFFLGNDLKEMALIPFATFLLCFLVVVIFRNCRSISEGTITRIKKVILFILIVANYTISISCLFYNSGKLWAVKTEKSSQEKVEEKKPINEN